jgi:hypothetical protein
MRPGARQRMAAAAAEAAARKKEHMDRQHVKSRAIRLRWEDICKTLMTRYFKLRGWAALKSMARQVGPATTGPKATAAAAAAVKTSRKIADKLKANDPASTAGQRSGASDDGMEQSLKAGMADLVFDRHPLLDDSTESPTPSSCRRLPLSPGHIASRSRKKALDSLEPGSAAEETGTVQLRTSTALQDLVARQLDAGAEQRRRLWGL